MKLIFFFCALSMATFGASLGFGQENQLPPDREISAKVIHGIKFPVKGKFSLHLGVNNYYGDRLAKTWGFSFEPRYHLSEKIWVSLPVSSFQSKIDESLRSTFTVPVYVSDPQLTVGPQIGWNPVYGKFLVGDYIQHFRAGLHGGLIGILPQGQQASWTYGMQLGAQIQAQLGSSWLLDIFSTSLIYPESKAFDQSNTTTRLDWQYGLRIGILL